MNADETLVEYVNWLDNSGCKHVLIPVSLLHAMGNAAPESVRHLCKLYGVAVLIGAEW